MGHLADAARGESQDETHFDFGLPVPSVRVVHTLGLILVLVALVAVVSMMVWTIVGWARSDRDRAERRARNGEQGGSGG